MKNETDPYNRAIFYLRKKYGENRMRGFNSQLFNELKNKNDAEIVLLIGQYHYGMSVKTELKNKLDSMKVKKKWK
jgi:hypothetical protein